MNLKKKEKKENDNQKEFCYNKLIEIFLDEGSSAHWRLECSRFGSFDTTKWIKSMQDMRRLPP